MEYQDDRAALDSAARLARYYISFVTLCVTLYSVNSPGRCEFAPPCKKSLREFVIQLANCGCPKKVQVETDTNILDL